MKAGQNVMVITKSKSKYKTMNEPISTSESFKITFENPCYVKRLVSIETEDHVDAPADRYSGKTLKVRHVPKITPSFCVPYFKCYATMGVAGSKKKVPCKELDENGEATY